MNENLDARSRRLLVTGAAGFVGRYLTEELASRGHEVVAVDLHLDRLEHFDEEPPIDRIEGDIADPRIQERAFTDVDTVFHLAAAHLEVSASPSHFRRVNVDAVESMVEEALRVGVRRFVHCSSVGVYGRIDNPPADEETPTQPELEYERTKLEGEQVVRRAIQSVGLPGVILRPVWIYGPGCPRTEKLIRAITKGRFAVAGSGRGLRHCVHIHDMVRALMLAAEREAALGQTIIVGDVEPVTIGELVDTIASLTGSKPVPHVPYSLMVAVAVVLELAFKTLGKEPPISRRTMRFFSGNTAFDIGRARRLLGFEPVFDIKSGIADTLRVIGERDSSKLEQAGNLCESSR